MNTVHKNTKAASGGPARAEPQKMGTKRLLALIAENLPALSAELPRAAMALQQGLAAAQDAGVDIPRVRTPVLSNAALAKLVSPALAKLLERAHLTAKHDRLELRNGKGRLIELPWLKMNAPTLGKAQFADRPNLILSEAQVSAVHRVDQAMSGAELEALGAGIEAIRTAAVTAEAGRQKAHDAKWAKISGERAKTAAPVTYSAPIYTGVGSELWKQREESAARAEREAYDAANAYRRDGSMFETSTSAAERAERQRRFDMGD